MRIAILDDYLEIAQRSASWDQLGADEVIVAGNHLRGGELEAFLDGVNVLCVMRERTKLTRELLAGLPALELIVTSGMYNSAIDLGAAADLGMTVCGTDTAIEPAVELTWALILAAVRQLPGLDRDMRDGEWQRRLGDGIHGRRLGIVGLGRSGSLVAKVGLAFGMDVVSWSQNLTPARADEVGVRAVTKDELLATSDIITVHLRLSERTHHLIDRSALERMRPGTIVVNTSRGPIVEEAALITALRDGHLGAAGLDVYDEEPLPATHPLRMLENVVLSPHVGYVTKDNMELFYRQMVEDIAAFQAGSPIRVVPATSAG